MSLFSRACMTTIALATLSFSIAMAPMAEARDRNEGGSHRSFSSHSSTRSVSTRADRGRDDTWKRRHHVDRDRTRDVIRGSTSMRTRAWTLRRADRWDHRDWNRGNWDRERWDRARWDRGNWNRSRQAGWDWRFDGSRRDGDAWGNRARPYYQGPARPYYAEGQDHDRSGLGNNFYGGSISAYEDPGNGNYFYFDGEYGDASGGFPSVRPQYGAKVIAVTPETETASCSWEAGVCVIRP